MGLVSLPRCYDRDKCFARREGKCIILLKAYQPGTCPFQKEKRGVTEGKYYPMNYDYIEGFNRNDEKGAVLNGNVNQCHSGSGAIFRSDADPSGD